MAPVRLDEQPEFGSPARDRPPRREATGLSAQLQARGRVPAPAGRLPAVEHPHLFGRRPLRGPERPAQCLDHRGPRPPDLWAPSRILLYARHGLGHPELETELLDHRLQLRVRPLRSDAIAVRPDLHGLRHALEPARHPIAAEHHHLELDGGRHGLFDRRHEDPRHRRVQQQHVGHRTGSAAAHPSARPHRHDYLGHDGDAGPQGPHDAVVVLNQPGAAHDMPGPGRGARAPG